MTEKKWPNVPPETKMKGERKRAEYGTGEDVERRHDWEREHAGRSRPHVAPCSCELHVRIRELEAELAKGREKSDAWHARFVQQHVVRSLYEETLARAEKAEARVAELEREREDHLAVLDRHALMPECAEEHHRAREREAD